ncbi:MAG: hypothetical protein Q9187_003307 [Circinaria calcarea]
MITEIVTFQLNDDVENSLINPSSPAGKVIRQCLVSELTAKGALYAYFGQLIEKPEMAIIFVGWDSFEDHKNFMSSAGYETHVNNLRAIIKDEKSVTVLHVAFAPSGNPSPALGANSKVGATEIVFFYFPANADKDAIMSSVDKMRPVMERSEALAVYDGWALEEVPNPGAQANEEEKARVFLNLVGWVDVEAHTRFSNSDDFKENIHHLLGIRDIRHTELYHARLYAI